MLVMLRVGLGESLEATWESLGESKEGPPLASGLGLFGL